MHGHTDSSLMRGFAGQWTIAIRIQFTHKSGIHLHETKEFFMTVIRTLGLLILFTIVGSTAHAHKSEMFLKRTAATELMEVMKMDKLMEQSTATMVDGMMAQATAPGAATR